MNPSPPRNMNPELARILEEYDGLFWLEGEHVDSTHKLFETITARFTRHRNHAELNFYTEKPRAIDFGFLCQSGLNAFAYASPAASVPEFDFIGINVGVIFTLMDIFGRILAHPENFPSVGNSQLETNTSHNLPFLTTNVMRSGFLPITPQCPIRSVFAGELAQVALDFLFFHELTHLRNGHIELLRSRLSLAHLSEAFSTDRTADDIALRQALEIDADCGAVLHTLNVAFQHKDLLANPSKSLPKDVLNAMKFAYGSPKQATRTVNFAAYILFRIFDTTEWLSSQQSRVTHPLPPLRMFFIGPTLYEIFSKRPIYQYDPSEFVTDNSATIQDAERACGLIRGDSPDLRGIVSVIKDDQYLAYIEEFERTWASIRSELELFKRGGKLAP